MLNKMYSVTRGFAHRFADGNGPYQMMTRLLEEAGELAQQVNHFEGAGVKREKHGEPDRDQLAKEILHVIHCALAVAVYYDVEKELEENLDWIYQRLKSEGHILDELEG